MTSLTTSEPVAQGWMLFQIAQPRDAELSPFPAAAPDADAALAGDWVQTYGLNATYAAAQGAIDADVKARNPQAFAEDPGMSVDNFDADLFQMYVSVDADGGISMHEGEGKRVEETATMAQVFQAYGLDVPDLNQTPALEI